jgi:hypothetical protein
MPPRASVVIIPSVKIWFFIIVSLLDYFFALLRSVDAASVEHLLPVSQCKSSIITALDCRYSPII